MQKGPISRMALATQIVELAVVAIAIVLFLSHVVTFATFAFVLVVAALISGGAITLATLKRDIVARQKQGRIDALKPASRSQYMALAHKRNDMANVAPHSAFTKMALTEAEGLLDQIVGVLQAKDQLVASQAAAGGVENPQIGKIDLMLKEASDEMDELAKQVAGIAAEGITASQPDLRERLSDMHALSASFAEMQGQPIENRS